MGEGSEEEEPLLIEVEGEEGWARPVAFCLGHEEGEERWRVLLKLADDRVVASTRSFATREEAYAYGVGWLQEQGGELAQ